MKGMAASDGAMEVRYRKEVRIRGTQISLRVTGLEETTVCGRDWLISLTIPST